MDSLGAINRSRCCFTAADFEEALLLIDHSLANYEGNEEISASVVAEKRQHLERLFAYSLPCLRSLGRGKPDRQLCHLLGVILKKYASLIYPESYVVGRQILLASLHLQFYSMGVFDDCIDMNRYRSLNDFLLNVKNNLHFFDGFEERLLMTNVDCCVAEAFKDSFGKSDPGKRLYHLADSVRMLFDCYQNMDDYRVVNESNDRRYKHLFCLCEALFILIDNARGRRELAGFYFHAAPFLFHRKHPADIDRMCALYDRALRYDNSPELLARIASGRSAVLLRANRNEEALLEIKKGLEQIKDLPETLKASLIKAEVYYQYAGVCLHVDTVDLNKASECMEKVMQYVKKYRECGDLLCFALYEMRVAELSLVLGEHKKGGESIESALQTLRKYPEANQRYLSKAEAIRSMINDPLSMPRSGLGISWLS